MILPEWRIYCRARRELWAVLIPTVLSKRPERVHQVFFEANRSRRRWVKTCLFLVFTPSLLVRWPVNVNWILVLLLRVEKCAISEANTSKFARVVSCTMWNLQAGRLQIFLAQFKQRFSFSLMAFDAHVSVEEVKCCFVCNRRSIDP